MLLLLVLIVLFGISTQYRDGFMDEQDQDQDQDEQDQEDQGSDQDQDDQDDQDQEPGMDSHNMSTLQRKLPPMVSSCVKDGLRQFDDLQ
jgi:flagellar biosynthesis/type III secretory pathway M-ring protein FliF/YscJ